LAHETIGTLPGEGTIRFSLGYHNTEEEVRLVAALVADFVNVSESVG
jgi:cysteine sulfinate desulfinase/cysteine desulfurase-like protein